MRIDETLKKEMNSCDCCGEDLATAHTVRKTLKYIIFKFNSKIYFRMVILNALTVETFSN